MKYQLALLLALAQAIAADTQRPGDNLALGKPCTFDPRPNYSYCTDPGDKTQLTDGVNTKGYFWTQKSTVGWSGAAGITITIDLGAVQPIRGVSFNTAAGAAQVTWPASIVILTSDDGKSFYPAGELINLSMKHGAATCDKYAVHRFWTDELRTHGRFVSFLVMPGGSYTFVDEIEIHRGEPDWLKLPFSGEGVTNAKAYQLHAAFEQRIRKDLIAVREAAAKLKGDASKNILAELDAVERELPSMPRRHDPAARVTLPLNPLHERVFRAQAMVWRAQKAATLAASAANPWDPLDITGTSLKKTGAVSVAMMQNEYRAGALNISNAGDSAAELRLQIAGLPGGTNPPYVAVHEVAWTDTRKGIAAAAALPEARRDGDAFIITVPSGMVRQVWFTFHPTDIKPGAHRGTISLAHGKTKLRVPLTLRVYPLRFPDQPKFHLGGWDYSDAVKGRDVTMENRDAYIRHLREHFVDSPWATASVLPHNLDTARFDEWLRLWPGARQYCIYAAVGEQIGRAKMGTPEFDGKVREWITFWAGHAKKCGLRPEQLVVLLVDEPAEDHRDNIILAWAKAVRAANTGVTLFEDVCHANPLKANQEMIKLCHVLCPNRPHFLSSAASYRDYFARKHAEGMELAFYSCNIGARLADPYSYFRLQAWTAWQYSAEASYFWAFSDSGGGSSWNEYAMTHSTCYTPLFLDPTTVTGSKQMEAIRESAEDYEYFVMLRARIAAAKKAGQKGAVVERAEKLLATAADRVLNAPDADKLMWADPKDRTTADRIRVEMLEAMSALAAPDGNR
ncbi:MAG: discoidin domain-containing protein [Verrucomicrobiia bacterium]